MPEWLKRLTKTDIRNSLAIIIVIGSFLLLYLLQVKPIPEQNHDLVLTAGGFIFEKDGIERVGWIESMKRDDWTGITQITLVTNNATTTQ